MSLRLRRETRPQPPRSGSPRRGPRAVIVVTMAALVAGALPVATAAAACGATSVVTAVHDSFSRTVSGGLGAADLGGTWATTGAGASFAVKNGQGRLVLGGAGEMLTAWLPAISSASTGLVTTVALDKLPSLGNAYVSAVARKVPVSVSAALD